MRTLHVSHVLCACFHHGCEPSVLIGGTRSLKCVRHPECVSSKANSQNAIAVICNVSPVYL